LIERLIAEHVVASGLATPERLQDLLASRALGDRRPLEVLLVEAGVLDAPALERLLAEVWGGQAEHLTHAPTDEESDDSWDMSVVPEAAAAPLPLEAVEPGGRIEHAHRLALELLEPRPGASAIEQFLVADPRLQRTGLLKLTRSGDPAIRRRFEREAAITAQLDHPGIPSVYKAGRTEAGHPYLLLRHLPGRRLDRVIDELHLAGRPTRDDLRPLVRRLERVCEAVAYAHSRGVIHRDLRPASVTLGELGEVCVTEWGLARDLRQPAAEDDRVRVELSATQGSLTQAGDVIGTPGWMAPEQARSEPLDARADVFSLGALLLRLLTDEPVYPGRTPVEQHLAAREGRTRPLASLSRGLDGDLRAILASALAPDPRDRLPSAEGLAELLGAWAEGRPLPGHRYGPLERFARQARRAPALFLTLSAGMLLILGLVAAGLLSADRNRRAERVAAAEAARLVALALPLPAHPEGPAEVALDLEERRERIARALRTHDAAQRWHTLAPDDPAAIARHHDSALRLGAVAQAAAQWPLALQAYAEASRLPVADSPAADLLDACARAREEQAAGREELARMWLRRAEAGALRSERAFTAALMDLASRGGPEATAVLLERVRALGEEVETVTRARTLALADPDEVERGRGEGRLDGLAEAIEAWVTGDPTAARRPPLSLAIERFRGRVARGVESPSPVEEARILGPGGPTVLRLCCEGLGRLRPGPEVVAALSRLLCWLTDVQLAAHVAVALCREGSPAALDAVREAYRRLDSSDHFSNRVRPLLRGREGEDQAPLPSDPEALSARAQDRFMLGDAEGALKALDAAIRAEPEEPLLLANRGLIRAFLGDEEGAADDYARSLALRPTGTAYAHRGELHARRGAPKLARADLERAAQLSPDSGRIWSHLAVLRARQGDQAAAYQAAARLEAICPNDPSAWNAVGTVRRLGEDLPGAQAAFERALELSPRFPEAWNNLGLALRDQGDQARAVAAFDRAIELAPEIPEPYENRGWSHLELGDVPSARRDLNHLVSAHPQRPGSWKARGSMRRVLGELELSEQDLSRSLELHPAHPEVLVERGLVRYLRKDVEGCLRDAARALELDPDLARGYSLRSAALQDQDDLDGALAAAHRALELDPDLPQAHYHVATTLQLRGDLDEAVQAAERGLACAPDDAHLHLRLGAVLDAQGKLDRAIEELTLALEANPRLVLAWESRGVAKVRAGDPREAIPDYTQALALDPNRTETWISRAYAYQLLGDLQRALADCTRALELEPTHVDALNNRSAYHLSLGQVRAAYEDVDRAVRAHPRHALSWSNRAGIRVRLRDGSGALADAEQACRLDPNLASAHFLRGRLLFSVLRDPVGARAALERAIELRPSSQALAHLAGLLYSLGLYQEAVDAGTRGLALERALPIALRARGLSYAALGKLPEAIQDLEAFLRVAPDDAGAGDVARRLGLLRGMLPDAKSDR
jgi:superkiller protein 3